MTHDGHYYSQDCNCTTCFMNRVKTTRKYVNKAMAGEKTNIIKMETTEGTKIEDDGEDGCCIDYRDFHEEIHNSVRIFDSGATRDTSEGKLEYARFISPIVLKRFAEYMNLHRKQTDGNLREPDNWMNLFGDKHEDVCLDSLFRHVMDVWLINKGFQTEAREDIEPALCAILFNAQAWLFKVLMDKQERKNNESK